MFYRKSYSVEKNYSVGIHFLPTFFVSVVCMWPMPPAGETPLMPGLCIRCEVPCWTQARTRLQVGTSLYILSGSCLLSVIDEATSRASCLWLILDLERKKRECDE